MAIPNDIGSTDFSTPSDTEIRAIRVFNAPRATIWAMHTDPQHLPNWMTGPEGWTMPVCEIDLRDGGRWRYLWKKSQGEEMAMEGGFIEVRPVSKLVTSECWGPEWPETINTVELTERGKQTVLTMTIKYPSKAARDAALGTGMKQGMNQSYARLDRVVAGMVAA